MGSFKVLNVSCSRGYHKPLSYVRLEVTGGGDLRSCSGLAFSSDPCSEDQSFQEASG